MLLSKPFTFSVRSGICNIRLGIYIDMIRMNIEYYLIRMNPFTVVPVYYKSDNIINVHNVAYESKA